MKTVKQTFDYKDKVVIEKATIRPPYRHEAIFQNQGCFLHLKGAATLVRSAQDNIPLQSQDAVLLKCNTYFIDFLKGREEDEHEVVAFHLYPELLEKIYNKELPQMVRQLGNSPKAQKVDAHVIQQFIASMDFYFEHPELMNEELMEMKTKELVMLLVQTGNISSIQELLSDLYHPHRANLREVIELHTFSNLSLDELAELCHMSLSSFKRAFKKEFGQSPAQYLTGIRLSRAKELLRISDQPVSDIAYELGFNDPLYFTRLFKKHEGLAPTAFRERFSA
ncbi:AraC family transcriptional regulator [Persicobacter diffluens]|uniref:HTH araC/xylS-type domain-containing protein n=1 Tax=Persicobacter diffluens TaxID=981 RepID=A0AAN5AP67_9BACT|nr:hypothetical protein PEDI_40600 [Persicobacter diffluens]